MTSEGVRKEPAKDSPPPSPLLLPSQDEVETAREELTFKDHRISELELAVRKEKEHAAALENETQVSPDVCWHGNKEKHDTSKDHWTISRG